MSVSTLTREEKALLKRKEKALMKKREEIYNEMLERDYLHRKENKVAPEGVCISLRDINKIYPNHVQAVYDFNLDIKPKEFIVLVGPSGCGKSTTLRMIAGLEDITYGDLFISSKFANDLLPKQRDVAMVFQNYALYPNLTVYDNLAFSLIVRHVDKNEVEKKVLEVANTLELTDYLKRRPAALSGGQKQRVALGRAIVRNANVFLMDEPLSNLDAKLRVQMRSEIVKIHRQTGATTVYVTHDQTEAMTMADRIVVMKDGRVQQIGTPKETYNNPENLFVASFIGSPAMNLLDAYYDQGKLQFSNGFEIEMTKDEVAEHDNFYVSLKEKLTKELENLNRQLEKRIYDFYNSDEKKDNDKFLTLSMKYQTKITYAEAGIRDYLNKNEISDTNNDPYVQKQKALIKKLEEERDTKLPALAKNNELKKAQRAEQANKKPISDKDKERIEKMISSDNLIYYYRTEIENINRQLSEIEEIIKTKQHDVVFGVRPEDIVAGKFLQIVNNPSKSQTISVSLCELLGNEYFVHSEIAGKDIVAKLSAEEKVENGQDLEVCFNLDHIHIFDKISSNRII